MANSQTLKTLGAKEGKFFSFSCQGGFRCLLKKIALGLYALFVDKTVGRNQLKAFCENGAVGKKPSETREKLHFQSHSCPVPDFWAEKGKNAIFSYSALVTFRFFSNLQYLPGWANYLPIDINQDVIDKAIENFSL